MKNIILWRCAAIMIICAAFLTSCSNDDETTSTQIPTDEVEAQLSQMTLREKVGQLFYVRPEALDTTIKTANLAALKLQAVNETASATTANAPRTLVAMFIVRFISIPPVR